MSDMKQIFGSDSESEASETKQDESTEQPAEVEVEEKEEENAEEVEAAENKSDGKDEKEQESNDDEKENDDHDDDEVVKSKSSKKTAEVFGDELDDLSEDSESSGDQNKNQNNDDSEIKEARSNSNLQDIEEEQEEEEEEQIISIEIPRVKADLGKEIQYVKLPNFLSVTPKPFDPEFYEDENPKGEALDEEGKTRVRLKVENTIRWRYETDQDGNQVKQSNAKIIKWSDGSLSLHLGNEIFDVQRLAMHGDHNHLFVRQGNVLQGQAIFKTKLSFRPHSIDSMTHKKMTMSLVDHGSRTKKVKIITEINKNPECNRNEMMKKADEKLKAATRRQNQQRRMKEKANQKGLSANFLEDRYSSGDDDEGGNEISLSAIKNRFKNRNDSRTSIYSSSDESDRERRLNKAKELNDDDDDNESDMDDDDLDARRQQAKNKKKKVVLDDEED